MSVKEKLLPLIDKLKADKKLVLFIAAGFLMIGVLFISELDSEPEEDIESCEIFDGEYCEYLENKIRLFIENIDGAGKAEVIITLAETTEYIYATDDKSVNKSNDKTVEKDFVIIEDNSNDTGLLIKTIEPKVRGVAISCEGGDNVKVQEQIYSSLEAILDIRSSDISISKLAVTEDKYEK